MVKKSDDLNLNVGVNSLRVRSQDRFNLRNDSQGRELDVRVDIFVVGVIGDIFRLALYTSFGFVYPFSWSSFSRSNLASLRFSDCSYSRSFFLPLT